MYNNTNEMNEYIFEGLLTKAFTEYAETELAKVPSSEELNRQYPPSLSGLKKLQRIAKARKQGHSIVFMYAKRVAVAVLVLAAVALGVLFTNTEVRAAIKNVFIEWCEEYVSFDFSGTSAVSANAAAYSGRTVASYEIGYIPDGFELAEEKVHDSARHYIYFCGDRHLFIDISDCYGLKILHDIEQHEYSTETLDGQEVHVFYSESENSGAVIRIDGNICIHINANVSENELKEILKNIK